MTKREQYNLEFSINYHGNVRRIITSDSVINSNLLFINHLSVSELQYFIDTINLIKNGELYDPDFLIQNGTEANDIVFNNPDIIIEGNLSINILHFQELLQEWLAFVNS